MILGYTKATRRVTMDLTIREAGILDWFLAKYSAAYFQTLLDNIFNSREGEMQESTRIAMYALKDDPDIKAAFLLKGVTL